MAGYGVALVACLAALVHLSAAAKYMVGDSTGWAIPATSSLYSSWAAKQTFKVGDSLVFNFQSGSHTVAEVSKSDYDACTTTTPITTFTTGPATVTLATAGAHYYLCTIPGHCSAGQKLAITASPKSSPAPSPSKTPITAPSTAPAPSTTLSSAAAPSPSAGGPVTASSPAPTPFSGSPVTAPSPAPTPAATPTPAPVPAPSSAGSTPAASPGSGATSATPSTEASPVAGGPISSTTPSSPSSGATAASGSVLSVLLIGAAFLF